MAHRRTYALVGAGNRSTTYMDGIAGPHREHAELVGLCDPSPTRLAWHNRRLAEQFNSNPIPAYSPADFDRMLRERKPDVVMITVPDYMHHDYAIRAMNAGCDVISEKPLTIDAEKLRAIVETSRRTGRHLRVTLNARYMPEMVAVRELLLKGIVGRPLNIELMWILDTSHGADYFRRWHREKNKSGGLLVHKASHHFDLVNWFADSYPQRIFAFGELKFYGRSNAAARGETYAYDRYADRPAHVKDPFSIDLAQDENARNLYLQAEKDSGYVRDRNVFGDGIDIEDTVTLSGRYKNGMLLNYCLIAYSPWEGLRLSITGTKGRVELYERLQSHIVNIPAGQEAAAKEASSPIRRLTVFPMFGVPYDVPIAELEGAHSGSDKLLMEDLFNPHPPADPLGRRSTLDGAAASILLGIAANRSIATGQAVDCDDILPLPIAKQ